MYRQWKNGILTQEELRSIIPEEIRREAYAGKLPDFRDYEADFLQTDEKVHYLDHRSFIRGNPAMGKYSFKAIKEYSFLQIEELCLKVWILLTWNMKRSAG